MADVKRKTANLFDKDKRLSGYFIRAGNTSESKPLGNIEANASFSTSDYIPVTPNTKYTVQYTYYDSVTGAGIVFFSDNSGTTISGISLGQQQQTYTFTTPNDCNYLRFSYKNTNGDEEMLNSGSTALPYEPYGWLHSLRKLTTATEAVENPLYSDGTAISTYTIKGNTVQSGTPSSQNPVMPNGCGERTANLVDESKVALNTFISYIGVTGSSTVSNLTDYIDISGSPFVISGVRTIGLLNPDTRGLCFYDSNKNFISGILHSPDVMSSPAVISNIPTNAKYVRFAFDKAFENGIMLNIGSTAKPYEPYGYKIPITSGGVTTNIYLGSTSSTRQIGKCILTGDEEYSRYDADRHVFRVTNTSAGISRLSGTSGICTHFERIGSQADLTDGQFAFGSEYIYFRIDSITYNPDFIAYIQEQYNNGTPVTVWYVLADEETAVVNEPLMKISDYSDSISNAVAIPTTDGANLITVDTTVQPSEFSATWTGWHDSSVKEYDGTDWQ